jgi:hypothetical protein
MDRPPDKSANPGATRTLACVLQEHRYMLLEQILRALIAQHVRLLVFNQPKK